jgi:hypothetical protein
MAAHSLLSPTDVGVMLATSSIQLSTWNSWCRCYCIRVGSRQANACSFRRCSLVYPEFLVCWDWHTRHCKAEHNNTAQPLLGLQNAVSLAHYSLTQQRYNIEKALFSYLIYCNFCFFFTTKHCCLLKSKTLCIRVTKPCILVMNSLHYWKNTLLKSHSENTSAPLGISSSLSLK